ncbi:MAG: sigma-70 family RNA polymerase sigma factor [Planctomycetota bacterium]
MHPQDEDVQLMLAVRDEDDRDAFEALVRKHQSFALLTAWRFLPNAASAQDIAQEAFLRLYRARKAYRPTAAFRTFFHRILVNLCYSALRRNRPAVSLETPRPAEEDTLAQSLPDTRSQAPDAFLETEELKTAVRRAVDSLPDNQRMAVILFRFQELSYAEIAAAMRTSEKAVKSLLARARAALKQKLTRYL